MHWLIHPGHLLLPTPPRCLTHQVLSGFNATTDFPSCTYYKFLLEANPKAKVVLTVRDPAAWYDSATSTIFAFTKVYESTVLLRHTPFMSMMRDASNLIPDMVFNPMFGGAHRLQDREHCMEVYRRHVEEVKRVVPKEQLLLFSVKDGWEPLCKFLGKPVPSTPFPNVNERAKFRKQILAIKIIDGALVLLTLALAIGLGYYAGKKM